MILVRKKMGNPHFPTLVSFHVMSSCLALLRCYQIELQLLCPLHLCNSLRIVLMVVLSNLCVCLSDPFPFVRRISENIDKWCCRWCCHCYLKARESVPLTTTPTLNELSFDTGIPLHRGTEAAVPANNRTELNQVICVVAKGNLGTINCIVDVTKIISYDGTRKIWRTLTSSSNITNSLEQKYFYM